MISSKLTAIPEELKQWNQWIVWRPVERNGKATKMPISVINGTPASTTDPETWVSFERAAGYIAANHDFNLGFVFSESDPFIGIDFDNIIEEGTRSASTASPRKERPSSGLALGSIESEAMPKSPQAETASRSG